MNGPSSWSLPNGATYDTTVSRNPGSGSIRIGPSQHVISGTIAVVPGKTYTIACYMKSGSWPPAMFTLFLQIVTSGGGWVRNGNGSRQSNSQPDEWEECVILFTPGAGEEYMKVTCYGWPDSPDPSSPMWIDEVYVGEEMGFEQPPAQKTGFDGSHVRVDDLGNFEVKKNGQWEPFFPLCMFTSQSRPDWTFYSAQGFNVDIWATVASLVQRAKDAVSTFNPDGMMSGFQMAQYTAPYGWAYGDTNDLRDTIEEIQDQGLASNLLFYYWDNENAYQEWAVPKAVVDTIRRVDVDGTASRMHPIYALQGNHGIARTYTDAGGTHFTDVTGVYMEGGDTGGASGSAGGLTILDRIEGLANPAAFIQINYGVGMHFRSRLYAGIAQGGKAMGFWADHYGNPAGGTPVEDRPWWSDFPNMRREIDQMLPLIRQPHWTSWQVTSSSGGVNFGTRDYNNEGHIIVANPNDTAKTTTFALSSLPYAPASVRNFFDSAFIASVTGGQFTVTIPAYGSAVYRLERGPPEVPVFTGIRGEGQEIVLSYSNLTAGYMLSVEQSTDLTSSNGWTSLTNYEITSPTGIHRTPASNTATFYRLKEQ